MHDQIAHSLKLQINFTVCEPQHLNTIAFNDFCADSVTVQAFFREMLRSINFDNQFRGRTIKVRNERINDALFVDFHRVITQEIIPQMAFLRCHFPAEFLCTRKGFVIFPNWLYHIL